MNHAKGNGLTAINSQPAKSHNQDTNDMNFATGTRNSKAESNLRAILATAGHAVPCERIRTSYNAQRCRVIQWLAKRKAGANYE